MKHAESIDGGGGGLLGFAAFGGSHGSSSMDSSFQDSNSSEFRSVFHNTAKNLHIELEYDTVHDRAAVARERPLLSQKLVLFW